jgi:DNA repair protein RadC
MNYGIHSLTDAELLAMLLNIPIDTAREIYGGLIPENKKAILGMSVEELSQLQGMGLATATRLKGILDFGKRITQSESPGYSEALTG